YNELRSGLKICCRERRAVRLLTLWPLPRTRPPPEGAPLHLPSASPLPALRPEYVRPCGSYPEFLRPSLSPKEELAINPLSIWMGNCPRSRKLFFQRMRSLSKQVRFWHPLSLTTRRSSSRPPPISR